MRKDTQLIHAGELRPRVAGAVAMPVFQSSTFELQPAPAGGELDYHQLRYIRLNNTPNHDVLHRKLAILEGAESALVSASGMAAISTTLLTVLRPGDHVLARGCLYGGTHDLFTGELAEFGIEHSFMHGNDPGAWASAVRPQTKVLYCETMTNPLLEVADLPAMARFARERGLISFIDNTFATPMNFRPIEHGFDAVLHSATKYLNGHSDIVAGVVAGRAELIERVRRRLNHLGGSLDPHACFLLHRGLKTLGVRMRHQNASGAQLAAFLEGHPRVTRVHYPGLASHPDHARARELLAGFGGMLSFEIDGGVPAATHVMHRLQLAAVAPSLGGPETLVTRPAESSHAGMDPQARRDLGIGDALIRVSVGLEAPEDLTADFEAALD
jgi:cystathionine beta-lyase/cystathionine gamma-synthase